MLLIVSPPLTHALLPRGVTQEFLYMTTKAAFSQAQASITMSLRLIQAAILITLREYTGTRADSAYVSLMSCAGMARVSGITTTILEGADATGDSPVDRLEKENIAWAIAMLERYE